MDKEENNAAAEGLSIIIPCLNEERFIGTLLACLARQTFQNFEALIIDGFSEDKTKEAVERSIARYPILKDKARFIPASKKGVACQRNEGARLARFERLVFFDADVQMPDTFLTTALGDIQKHDLDLATSVFAPISSRVDDWILYRIGNLYLQAKQFISPGAMGFCIFSTKQVHNAIGGFDETLKLSEDMDYVERAAKLDISFRILTKKPVYISIRRLNKEGRYAYYKKALWAELLAYVKDKKELGKSIEYEFGNYDKVAK